MKFAELERLFVKISQKRRFPGVKLGCRLEVRRSPRLIFVQSGEIYRRIWPWERKRLEMLLLDIYSPEDADS
jgi:hypothetical protein